MLAVGFDLDAVATRALAGFGSAVLPGPDPTTAINVLIADGDSIAGTLDQPVQFTTSNASDAVGKFPSRIRANLSGGKTMYIRARGSRHIGTAANLNDLASNTLFGAVVDNMTVSPDLVGYMIGNNDLTSDGAVSDNYVTRLIAIYNEYKARKPGIKVWWSPPIPMANPGPEGTGASYPAFTARRDALLATCRDPAVWSQWCDYFAPIGLRPEFTNGAASTYLYADIVHPTVAGDTLLGISGVAFMNSLMDPSRINSTALYDAAWLNNETDLPLNTQIVRAMTLSGLAHAGVNVVVAIAGGGAQMRLNGGAWTAALDERMYNGDVIEVRLTTSAANSTEVYYDLTVNGETRRVRYTTLALSQFNALFSTAAGAKSPNSVVSANKKTFSGSDFGSQYPTRGRGDTALTEPTGYIEFTLSVTAKPYRKVSIGLANADHDFSAAAVLGKTADSFSVDDNIFYAGSGAAALVGGGFPGDWQVDGEVIGLLFHQATGKAWLRRASGWYPDTPTFDPDGSPLTGTGMATGMVAGDLVYFAAGQQDDSGATINAGASAFTHTAAIPANVTKGWK